MSLTTVGRNLAEGVTEGVEQVDFFSETTIGACVTCCISILIWLFFLPLFNFVAVPWMTQWEGTGMWTVPHYMERAEETYITPKATFYVLDANADGNSTLQEFLAGSKRFKRPPFKFDEEAIPLFHDLDDNRDGSVSPQEFYDHVPSKSGTRWHTSLAQVKDAAQTKYGSLDDAYKVWDTDSDLKVSVDGFRSGARDALKSKLLSIDDGDGQVAFNLADKNHNGYLEPREWVSLPVQCFFRTMAETKNMPSESDLNMAMEASILEFMKAIPGDVADCKVKEEPSTSFSGRRLTTLSLVSNCTIQVGTQPRQSSMQGLCQQLPNADFTDSLENHLGGAPAKLAPAPTPPPTAAPAGPAPPAPTTAAPTPPPAPGGKQPTIAQVVKDLGILQKPKHVSKPKPAEKPHSLASVAVGPISDKELQAYVGHSCILEGDTAVFLENFKCDDSHADQKLDAVKLGMQDLIQRVTGNIPQMQSVQIVNNVYYKNNVTVSAKWEIDAKDGGSFQTTVKADGWRLDQGVYDLFHKQVPMECMHEAKVRQFTQFTAQYYGLPAHLVPRGLSLEQEYGLAWTQDGLANFTGSSPYIEP